MVGQTVSHYRILEKLGEGGMGVVYRAHDTRLDRDVALKFLPASLDVTSDEVARFEQEARAISALNHPNIATIFDIDEAGGRKFLVLEFINGGTLKSRIRKAQSEEREFSIAEITDYALQMAEGLAHAHRHHIIHRDIKSDNIMLTEDGKVKITDFGLAKLRGVTRLTRTGSTLGTLSYMAPEQLRGEEIDERADLFSLGVVLYELATARLPFRGEHEAALTYSIANEEPVPAKTLRPGLPEEFSEIIAKALQKDRALRYQSAAGLVADLKKFHEQTTGAVKTVVREKRSRVPWVIAAGLLILGAVGLYLFLPLTRPAGANSKTIAVLPFTNLTENKQEEYFSDGITEDILTQLAKVSDLNVISRTSVMQYKGTRKGIREIGKELNAGVILEGSVRHAGDQVRIVAQLIDATNDKHIWAETYDREYKEVFAIQSEISRNIAGALKAQLSSGEAEKLRTPVKGNPETYSLLLQGRYYAARRDSASTMRAIDILQRALAIDSTDARLWAAWAGAMINLGGVSTSVSIQEAMTAARHAAERAVALDEDLAEAHGVLAFILSGFAWDWKGADREFQRALALEPGNAAINRRAGVMAMSLGRFDEAIRLNQKSIELDPVSDAGYSNFGILCIYTNRLPEAKAAIRKTLELNPLSPGAYSLLGTVYLLEGKVDSALIASNHETDNLWRLFGLSLAYYAAGEKKEADGALREMIAKYQLGASYQIASVYAFRNEIDRAFEWLDKAYELRDGGVTQIIGDPAMKNLEKDPRYTAFLRKVGLVD